MKATRKEVCNFDGEWEAVAPGREHEKRLEQTYTSVKGRYRPSESSSRYISSLIEGRGQLTRLDNRKNANRRYGVEIIIAQQIPHQNDHFRLTKFIQKKTKIAKDVILHLDEIKQQIPELLMDEIKPAKYLSLIHI